MVRTPISCPTSPEWNKRKREFSKLYVPAQILESPPAVSPDSSKSYVDLKINGSDGPIKIKAGESALNITYTTNTGKYCILVQGGKGLYWDWDITAVSKYSSIPEFDTLFTQNRSALVYLRLYAKDIQKYLYEYKTMQLHRISLNIFCNTTGYKFTSRTLLLSDPALLKDKVEIQVVP
jgi:hypothetical protein